jgi:hypothetical protein
VLPDPTAPSGKRQHLIETCNFVDAGSSRLLLAQVYDDFHAQTAFDAVVTFLRAYGLPTMLTLDRDVLPSSAVPLSAISPLHCSNFCIALVSSLMSFRRIILN